MWSMALPLIVRSSRALIAGPGCRHEHWSSTWPSSCPSAIRAQSRPRSHGGAGMRGELVGKVQRVDPGAAGTVEAAGPEGDRFVVVLGCDVDHDTARGEVLDGEPECGPADAVDDEIEVAIELLGDGGGADAAQPFAGCGGIANQRGDVRAARAGELDGHPPASAGRACDH